jgi:serine/threonine protein kinase
MAVFPDDTPESLDGQVTSDGEPDRPVEKSIGERKTVGNDPSTDFGGEAFAEDWTPPEMLADRYRLEKKIGQGGMGVVYRAHDSNLNITISVKLISGGTIERFRTEAQSIAALNHPSIVRVYEFNQQDGLHYIVMEHVAGESLLDRLRRDGTIPTEEAIRITVSLCDALSHAHGKGIIHRDIKPSNVLLSSEGVPKLVDFGLARIESDQGQHTRAGATLGTIDYMSPEQRRDAAGVDHRSDLWSLGATFYEMLTGEPPHPVDMDSIAESVHSTMAKVLKRNPDDRYQTADDFRDALKVALDSPVAPQPRTVPEGGLAKGQCRECGAINEAEREFCGACGKKLFQPCLACEVEIGVWERFCGKCGANVAEQIEAIQQEYQDVFEQIDALCGETQPRDAVPDAVSEIDWLADHLSKLRARVPEAAKLLKLDHPLIVQESEQLRQVNKVLLETIERLDADRASHPKRLTKEIAERLLTDPDSVELGKFTDLDDDAAEILSKCGANLDLYGLTELSEAAAECLSKYDGWLNLEGLTSLSDAVAESLSRHEGELILGLTSLSDSAAEILSKHKGMIDLNDLTSLSDSAAEILSRHEGAIELDGLTSLSDAVAESLSKHKGMIDLNGLKSLSDTAAERLRQHGNWLGLHGLTSLSDAAAESLRLHGGGHLGLNGLRSLSDAAAESLSKYKGELTLCIYSFSGSAAELLRQHWSFQNE